MSLLRVVTGRERPAVQALPDAGMPLLTRRIEQIEPVIEQQSTGAPREPVTGRGAGGFSIGVALPLRPIRRPSDLYLPPAPVSLPGGRTAY